MEDLQRHVEGLRARGRHHHQHQLVRERGRRRIVKAAAAEERALVVPPEEETSTDKLLEGPRDREGDDEEVVVEQKVALLRQLVPGGEGMAVEGLLEETADYIAALKAQVGAMRALTCLLSGSGSGSDLDALRPESLAAGVLTPDNPM